MEVRNYVKNLKVSINFLLRESEQQNLSQKIKDELMKIQVISEKLYKSELNGKEKCELEEEIKNLKEKVIELEKKRKTLKE
jgi:hypothetical protein